MTNGYIKIHERIAQLETKLKIIERLLYVVVLALAGQYGITIVT